MNKEKILKKYKESELATESGYKILNFLLDNFDLREFTKFNFKKLSGIVKISHSMTANTVMDIATAKIFVRKIESKRVTLFKLNPELLGE